MKISELSQQTGIPLPTLKFYLREGLLPAGARSQPNQADYSEAHVRRAELIRALREVAGLSIAKIRTIVEAMEHGEPTYDLMGETVDALGGETVEAFTPAQAEVAGEVDAFLHACGLPVREESLARRQIIAAFTSVRAMLFPGVSAELLAVLCGRRADRAHGDGRDPGIIRTRTGTRAREGDARPRALRTDPDRLPAACPRAHRVGAARARRLIDQRVDHHIDDGVCLLAHLIIGRILNWMRDEDAADVGQAERFGLNFGGVDELG